MGRLSRGGPACSTATRAAHGQRPRGTRQRVRRVRESSGVLTVRRAPPMPLPPCVHHPWLRRRTDLTGSPTCLDCARPDLVSLTQARRVRVVIAPVHPRHPRTHSRSHARRSTACRGRRCSSCLPPRCAAAGGTPSTSVCGTLRRRRRHELQRSRAGLRRSRRLRPAEQGCVCGGTGSSCNAPTSLLPHQPPPSSSSSFPPSRAHPYTCCRMWKKYSHSRRPSSGRSVQCTALRTRSCPNLARRVEGRMCCPTSTS